MDAELNETRLDLPFTIVNITTTIAAFVLPFYFYSRSAIAAFLVFYTITGLGLTLGYHRLFAHRAFEVPRWLRIRDRDLRVSGDPAGTDLLGGDAPAAPPIQRCSGPGSSQSREGLLHVHFGWTQRRRRDIWEKERTGSGPRPHARPALRT